MRIKIEGEVGAEFTKVFDAATDEALTDVRRCSIFFRADIPNTKPVVELVRLVPSGDDSNPIKEVHEQHDLESIVWHDVPECEKDIKPVDVFAVAPVSTEPLPASNVCSRCDGTGKFDETTPCPACSVAE